MGQSDDNNGIRRAGEVQSGLGHVPHAAAVGMEVIKVEKGRATLRIPYADFLVGDPETGVVHGGVITTILDNASGIAVFTALDEPTSIATLDLRIDYMRPATPGEAIHAEAHCYKVTRSIAFVRGTAYHNDPAEPIAASHGAFMLSSDGGRTVGSNLK